MAEAEEKLNRRNAISCRGNLLELARELEGGHDDSESRAWRGWGLFIYRAGARLQSVRLAGARVAELVPAHPPAPAPAPPAAPTSPAHLLTYTQTAAHLLFPPSVPSFSCIYSLFLHICGCGFPCRFLFLSCLVTSHTPMLHLQSRRHGMVLASPPPGCEHEHLYSSSSHHFTFAVSNICCASSVYLNSIACRTPQHLG